MRPLTGLEERVSYVHFWLELLLRGWWSGWVRGFSEPVTATWSPQSSTGLLSRGSASPPSQPRILSLQGGDEVRILLRAAHFPPWKKENEMPFNLFCCLSFQSIFMKHSKDLKKKSISKCNYSAVRSRGAAFSEIMHAANSVYAKFIYEQMQNDCNERAIAEDHHMLIRTSSHIKSSEMALDAFTSWLESNGVFLNFKLLH